MCIRDNFIPLPMNSGMYFMLKSYTSINSSKYFLSQIKDRNSADYKKYFDELMDVYDLRMKYIPEFIGKGMKLSLIHISVTRGPKAGDELNILRSRH